MVAPTFTTPQNQKIYVIQVIAGFSIEKPLGGIERFVVELSTHLDQNRFHPVVFGLWRFENEYSEKWKGYLNQAGVETIEGQAWDPAHPYRSFLRSYRVFSTELEKRNPDIVHSHNQFGDIMAMLFKWRGAQACLVRTTHNEQEWRRRWFRRLFLWGLLYPLSFRGEIGLNAKMVEVLDRRPAARLMKKKSYLIPNALNLNRFASDPNRKAAAEIVRTQLNIPINCPVVGSVGRLTQQKGYADFLKAASLVLESNPSVYFVIVGSGELEGVLKTHAQELGIANRVIFAGSRSNVEDYYNLFDLFVSSSLWEGLPTVVMESMASGTPVVATDITGTKDLILDGVTGWLVPPGDASAMAVKILFALENQDVSLRNAHQAFKQVNQHSIEHAVQSQTLLYLRLLDNQSTHEA